MVTEKQLANLKPFGQRTERECKEIRSKGGKATKAKFDMQEMFKSMVESMATHKLTETEYSILNKIFPNIKKEDANKMAMLVGSLYNQGVSRGNTKAIELFLKALGVLKDQSEISGNIVTQKVFVTQGQQQAVDKHIKEVIADDGKSE